MLPGLLLAAGAGRAAGASTGSDVVPSPQGLNGEVVGNEVAVRGQPGMPMAAMPDAEDAVVVGVNPDDPGRALPPPDPAPVGPQPSPARPRQGGAAALPPYDPTAGTGAPQPNPYAAQVEDDATRPIDDKEVMQQPATTEKERVITTAKGPAGEEIKRTNTGKYSAIDATGQRIEATTINQLKKLLSKALR
jgi:hypothetical protein